MKDTASVSETLCFNKDQSIRGRGKVGGEYEEEEMAGDKNAKERKHWKG
jgi:hypothetical protein